MKKLLLKIVIIILAIIAIVLCGVFIKKKLTKKDISKDPNLNPPAEYWCAHFQTFFFEDEFVKCGTYDGKQMDVEISDIDKYTSLFKCFNGGNWKYGSEKIKINFIYTGNGVKPKVNLNAMYDNDIINLFKGNKYFIDTHKEQEGFQFFYVILKPEVIQTYIDNLTSPYGVDTLSVETLCKNILFKGCKMGVQFCSDKK